MEDKDKVLTNSFNQLITNIHPSLQPEGSYTYALNAVKKSSDFRVGGLANEQSTELCANLKDGYELRGATFIEERDQWVLFSYEPNSKYSEIGYADLKTCVYHTILNDSILDGCCLGFNQEEWIHIESKRVQPCNEIKLYWSNNGTYKTINLDEPSCNLNCDKLELFKGVCNPTISTRIKEDSGFNLLGGAYSFAVSLKDEDNNTTDFFSISDPIYVGTENNTTEERSKHAISLRITNLDPDYTRAVIAVIRYHGGATISEIVDTIPYNSNGINYVYRGLTGREEAIPIAEILAKNPSYIRGKDLIQYKGRLILYNTFKGFNLDYQLQAIKAQMKYTINRVHINDAHKYKTLRRREVYSPGIIWNFDDGTTSPVFPLIGREALPADRVVVEIDADENCTNCKLEKWQVEDTSFRTEVFVEEDIFADSVGSIKEYVYTPDEPPVLDIEQEWEQEEEEIKQDAEEIAEIIKEGSDAFNEAADGAEGCSECDPELDSSDPSTDGEDAPPPPPPYADDFLGLGSSTNDSFGSRSSCSGGVSSPCGASSSGVCGQCGQGGGPVSYNGGASFTATDIYGNSHDLETYIQSGNTVILDFFAIWCTPCLNMAQSGVLSNILANNPNTVVIAVEADTNTTDSALISSPFPGLMSGYPIVNLTSPNDITSAVGLTGYPSIVVFNPDGTYANLGNVDEGGIQDYINSRALPNNPASGCGVGGGCSGGSCGGGGCSSCTTCGNGGSRGGAPASLQKLGEVTEKVLPTNPKYDAQGCVIEEYLPVKIAEGEFGYWESTDTYPVTRGCDGEYLYGDLAGRPIRKIKIPSAEKEPHYISYNNGVPSLIEPANDENSQTYVNLIGLSICGIEVPTNLPRPLCKQNPFSIVMQPRGESDKSVIASGNLYGTFEGESYGEKALYPKNGANSLELFDAHINRNVAVRQDPHPHAGYISEVPGYILHSPDTHLNRVGLDSYMTTVDLEVFGQGFRHGLYADGTDSNDPWIPQTNQKGARGHIYLNKFRKPTSDISTDPFDPGPDGEYPDPEDCGSITLSVTQSSCTVEPNNITSVNALVNIIGLPANIIGFNFTYYMAGTGDITITTPFSSTNVGADIQGVEGLLITGNYSVVIQTAECTYSGSVLVSTNSGVAESCTDSQSETFQGVPIGGNGPLDGGCSGLCYKHVDCDPECYCNQGTNRCQPRPPGNVEIGDQGAIIKCNKSVDYLHADSTLAKGVERTLAVVNRRRESSVFIEFNEGVLQAQGSIDRFLTDGQYNGLPGENVTANSTSDGSFLGDVFSHDTPIYNAFSHYASLIKWNPNQYGRLEGAVYELTNMRGTHEDVLCGKIEGLPGDAFIGQYTVVRTSYVSTQVGADVIPRQNIDLEETANTTAENAVKNLGIKWAGLRRLIKSTIKGILKIIFRAIGLEIALGLFQCGDTPITRSNVDPRNTNGLRGFQGGFWDGLAAFTGLWLGWRRVYYPGTQKTLLVTIVESDTNLHFRKTGSEDLNEIHYPNLKGYNIDSWENRNKGWLRSFLNRFYIELAEVALMKKVYILLSLLFLKIAIPLWFLVEIVNHLRTTAGGGAVGLVATILVAIYHVLMALLLLMAGFAFIRLANFLIRNYLVQVLGINQCFNDTQGSANTRYLKDFVDHNSLYEFDYQKTNSLSVHFGMPFNYNTCICLDEPTPKVIYSNVQLIESPTDAYRNFKINNYLDITSDYGPITNIFILGDQVYVHTTDTIINLFAGSNTLEVNESTVYLGQGSLFQDSASLYGKIIGGYAGNLDQNAAVMTPMGYMFIDREARKLYNFNGQLEEISLPNDTFFKENNHLILMKQFPDFKMVDQKSKIGVGYNIGFDSKLNRVLYTKNDFEAINPDEWIVTRDYYLVNKDGRYADFSNQADFIDRSFTLSYDLEEKVWISYHSYQPIVYMWDRINLYSTDNTGVWLHNSNRKSHQWFYGKYYPFIVEYVSKPDGFSASTIQSIAFDTEANIYNDEYKEYVYDIDKTFNKAIFYSTRQSTGIQDLVQPNPDEDVYEALRESSTEIKLARPGLHWRINNLYNRVDKPDLPLFNKAKNSKFTDKEVNKKALSSEFKSDILFNKYMFNRFIFDNFADSDIQLIFKLGLTKINIRPE
jgi:thiol-disulfide isomerase/thioredoxin